MAFTTDPRSSRSSPYCTAVAKALEVIWKELDISMALCGVQKATDLSREHLLVPEDFEGRWA